MIKKITLIAILTAFVSVTSWAQKNFSKEAEKAFDAKEYYGAIEFYKKAYEKEKNKDKKARMLFQMAECYRHISDTKSAETYYNKAIGAKYNDPISYYHLGMLKKNKKLYNEAIADFQKYKAEVPSSTEVESQIKSCELAQTWVDKPTRHKVENMALINSKEEDFSPAFADYKKYNKIYFTTTRPGVTGGKLDATDGELHSDLFETTLSKDGKWSSPTNVAGTNINTDVNEGSAVVSHKGDFMIFTRCEEDKGKKGPEAGKNRCHLYLTKKLGPSWGEPEKLPINMDTVDFRYPTLSTDGNMLIFSSNMTGGYGHHDLWMTEFDKKSKSWGTPVNLGPNINTSGHDGYPFLHEDGKTLYYSTDGLLGLGGLDIFKVEMDANKKFTKKPENLQFPMNSPYDDFGVIFQGKQDKGYFSSNREGGKGSDDIWSFVLPALIFNASGTVLNMTDKTPIPNCPVVLKGTDGTLVQIKADEKGNFKMALKPEVSYEIYTQTDNTLKTPTAKLGFLASDDVAKITTVGLTESTEFTKEFLLKPVEEEIKMPAILYALGKWDLMVDKEGTNPQNETKRPLDSQDSLNFLYNILIKNPTIVVELSSHTDSRGATIANDTLSQRRAKSCVDYLISKGIPKERMVAKGWGERKLKITDAQIAKAKTKEEKNALHQINRRTAFKILRWDYQDPNKPKVEIPTYHPPVKGEDDADKLPTTEGN